MIRYSQIENLPSDHPLVLAFVKQEREVDECYQQNAYAGPEGQPKEDSLDYFDRYVAGDRK